MKKFARALMAAAVAVFGVGMVAEAYPPAGTIISVDPPFASAGEPVTVVMACVPPEQVTLNFPLANADASTLRQVRECETGTSAGSLLSQIATGRATFTFDAPTTPGTYTLSFTGSVSGDLGSLTLVVEGAQTPNPSGGLPATGSDGIGTTTWIAGGLLIVGLGLFGVATVRRRQPLAS